MTRGFFGFGGSSKGSASRGKNKGPRKSSDLKGSRYEEKPDYNSRMKERIEQYKTLMMQEARSSSSAVTLPGTDPNEKKELSQGAQDIIRQMAEIKAKKDAKREKRLQSFLPPKKEEKKKPPPLNFSGTFGGVADNGWTGDGRGPKPGEER